MMVILLMLMTNSIQYGCECVAASAKGEKALKAYNTALKDVNSVVLKDCVGNDYKFAVIDINDDGVKEMVTTGDDGYHCYIFSFINGSIKEVCDGYAGGEKFYPNKKIYCSTTTRFNETYTYYYKFTGKKMILMAEKKEDAVDPSVFKYDYKVNNKSVSKKKYNKYIKKLMSGAKEKNLSYKVNDERNRNKYLR